MSWTHPVPGLNGRLPSISSGFGEWRDGNSRQHMGSDIMFRRVPGDPDGLPRSSKNYTVPYGHPAVAVAPGKVLISEEITTGGYVRIQQDDGLITQYMHLNPRKVSKGQRVTPGQVVGTIGYNPAGYQLNHLHFEVLRNGDKVDPAQYIANAQVIAPPAHGINILTVALIGLTAYGAYRLMSR